MKVLFGKYFGTCFLCVVSLVISSTKKLKDGLLNLGALVPIIVVSSIINRSRNDNNIYLLINSKSSRTGMALSYNTELFFQKRQKQ